MSIENNRTTCGSGSGDVTWSLIVDLNQTKQQFNLAVDAQVRLLWYRKVVWC